jgi:chromosome segregation protein
MVQFDKLRLSGFKSFVDPTELTIESGMTGIVGPNGCGKSNLVEAMKWVMGETSAKQMRGSEMEDVIFAGTGSRPARNIAEVMLTLDNKTRTAPAMVNDSDQLDIVRRIERGHGSAYSVNGREIRARDVQTLFADAATGSRSTAMVSQGRIGALINAKPADRRMIIDEAAGITGLYARRHEAELRLRAAEANLARVQDVLVALEEQHKGLKRQARQASRYRNLSDHIRRAEAAVLALKLANAERDLAEAGERLKEAEAQVADLTRLVGLATTAQAEAAMALPPLRNDEAAAAAALQRLRVAHDALTAEAERVAQAQQEAGTRLAQTETDLEREHGRKSDADAAIADLDSQRERLEQERVGEDERAAEAAATRDAAQADTLAAETEHDRLTRQIADDEALRESVGREVAELRERLRRLAARRDEVTAQQQQVEAELANLPALPEVEAALAEARLAFEEARRKGQESIDAAREAERYESDAARAAVAQAEAERLDMERARAAERQAAEASHVTANETLQKVNARLTKLRAEEAGVAAALKSAADSLWPPLLDALTVDPGFEKALGAAFGEELEASSDRGAPIHWLPLGPIADAPALPDGATPLGAHVRTMPELERRLAFIGVVADEATGAALQDGLKPGQQLVTRDGGVWRWDGYVLRAGAPSTAAVRLSQRNRLAEIRQQIEGVAAEHAEAQTRVEAETGWLAAARDAEKTCVEQARAHERSVADAARRKTEGAGEATRAAERAAQQSIAIAERAATEARGSAASSSRSPRF